MPYPYCFICYQSVMLYLITRSCRILIVSCIISMPYYILSLDRAVSFVFSCCMFVDVFVVDQWLLCFIFQPGFQEGSCCCCCCCLWCILSLLYCSCFPSSVGFRLVFVSVFIVLSSLPGLHLCCGLLWAAHAQFDFVIPVMLYRHPVVGRQLFQVVYCRMLLHRSIA